MIAPCLASCGSCGSAAHGSLGAGPLGEGGADDERSGKQETERGRHCPRRQQSSIGHSFPSCGLAKQGNWRAMTGEPGVPPHKRFPFFRFAAAFAKFCFTLSFAILSIKPKGIG
jgi:hypothetical protein